MAIPKKQLEATKAKEEARAALDVVKQTLAQAVHDKKASESAAVFKNAKITSCSRILQKNGENVALAFNNGAGKPVDLNAKRLPEVTSISQDQFKVRENLHAGMLKKPLEPYHPNAFRSRLPQPTVVMPYKNSSQIVIGDRSSHNKHHFKTVN